ncbi:hypothetical protein [Klebsiella sp. BIGb0407]|uniref:hypothetical protein n=1 Tax=Klebsiella sp. BIGb0407 TaxID=2940603 RepID=UPI00216965DC|nr:hypothetical protein [Klebsiella sp. BIGb0407]MCS3432937.1 hypothetical protein [Klebsiella sp. BIGb0407]
MGTAHEHREKREIALSLANAGFVEAFLGVLPVEDILLDRIAPEHWSIVNPTWRNHPERKHLKVDLNWLRQRNKRRDKLDVSIWCGEYLCGLFLAKLSRKRVNVALRFLESNPNDTPLSGYMIPLGLIIAESFAHAYGAKEVMVSQPDKLLIPLYREQGFELIPADQSREKRSCNIRAKVLVKKLMDTE